MREKYFNSDGNLPSINIMLIGGEGKTSFINTIINIFRNDFSSLTVDSDCKIIIIIIIIY